MQKGTRRVIRAMCLFLVPEYGQADPVWSSGQPADSSKQLDRHCHRLAFGGGRRRIQHRPAQESRVPHRLEPDRWEEVEGCHSVYYPAAGPPASSFRALPMTAIRPKTHAPSAFLAANTDPADPAVPAPAARLTISAKMPRLQSRKNGRNGCPP